ncbi:unnamed protein product [Paramecium sonneborni]|uniref:C3H1-type domain-containing protein n=1 Tax=Paramecium sonneborni TaxID=65129 RepID=A0A8S1L5N9_9CILI|nr:unnamed protein product [Paramecium sonneborni]
MNIFANQYIDCKDDWEEKSTSAEEKDDETFFEIDVKPKRQIFETKEQKKQFIEEYTKKKKTELCKNYEALGYCKFGLECSFAHGQVELQPKIHLHQKYRTKPCTRYFNQGFCPYGIRCQYQHNNIINHQEFDRYLLNCYKLNGMKPPISQKFLKTQERLDVQRFQQIFNNFQKQGLTIHIYQRSKFFKKLENQYNQTISQ